MGISKEGRWRGVPRSELWVPPTSRGWEEEQEPAKEAEKWPGRWWVRYSGNHMERAFKEERLILEEETQTTNKNMKRHMRLAVKHIQTQLRTTLYT